MGEWIDAEALPDVILGAIAVLGVLAVVVMWAVRRLLLKVALIVLIGALAASLWVQRADLQDCVETCSCRLFGQNVEVPADANPNCS